MSKLSVEQALSRARSQIKKGQYQEAKKLYEDILEKFPKNSRVEQALAELKSSHQSVTNQQPPQKIIDGLSRLLRQGQLLEVVEQATDFTKSYPNSFVLWNVMGLALKGLSRFSEASKAFKQVTELNGTSSDGFNNYGISLHDEGKLQEALTAFKKALAFNPHHSGAYYNMGITLQNQGKLEEAIAAYRTLLSLTPNNPEAYCNLGNALKEQNKPDDAIMAFKKALSLQPSHYRAYYNWGNLLKDQGRLEEALEAYEKAVSIQPNYVQAFANMGTTLKDQGRLNEAINAYRKVLSINPNHAEVNFNLGTLLWLQKDFENAFELMEWRWKIEQQRMGVYLESRQPRWDGEHGKRIFAWKEQGIGDQVMFGSVLTGLSDKSKRLIVECDERLMPLFRRSFNEQIEFVSTRKKVDDSDYENHIAIGSLLRFFRNDINDFKKTSGGWLKPDPLRTNQLRKKLRENDDRKVIGISWFTNSKLENSKHRNVSTDILAEYLRLISGKYINLQYGETLREIHRLNSMSGVEIHQVDNLDLFNDLDGPTALISACDTVISIDNATVNLAGALGVDTRVLLPLRADDRWGLNSSESYWYDSVQLCRQQEPNNWHGPLQQLVSDLNFATK